MFPDADPFDALEVLHGSPLDCAARARKNPPNGFEGHGLPVYLASGLFRAGTRRREIRERMPLAFPDAPDTRGPRLRARFSGERFDQDDLDVFLACVELALADGGTARFNANALLHRLERRVSPQARHCLAASLWRMEAGRLELADGSRNTCVRLFSTVLVDHLGGACRVGVHSEVLGVFRAYPGLAALIRDRLRLKGRPMVQWLLGFLRVFPEDCLLDPLKLGGLCGGPAGARRPFAARVHESLKYLADMGYLAGLSIRPDGRALITRPDSLAASGKCLLLV